MSSKGELLSQEELGFLLTDYDRDGEARDPTKDPWSVADADAVTLRGDLIDTRFSDLLLSLRDEEGVLRVTNPLEEHFLYLRSGTAQDMVVKRHLGRRVGQRLVAAGELLQERLEEALKIHKRDGDPLGKVLVSQGFAKADLVARHIEDQSVEDFYSLFTWSVGQFEFRPGPPEPEHREQFAELPQFDVELVIDEVAARREEWDRILGSAEGLEGVIRPLRAAAVRLPAPHASILRNLDGQQSLRELAESTMLGLFECARAVKDLYDWKLVESAEPAQLLTIARSRLVQGEPKRAAMILQSLWTRLDPGDHEFAAELADALQRCGENRIAARCLLLTAEHSALAQDALELARKAYKADPRSLEVLTFLRDKLLETHGDEAAVAEVACAITDALAREGRFEEALEAIKPFAAPRHDSVVAFGRKVRLLCRLGSHQEAVADLLALAQHYHERGDRHREAAVYEHILRIDGNRADVARKLQAARPRVRKPVVTTVRVCVLMVAAAIGGGVYLKQVSAEKLRELVARVGELLDRQDADGALSLLDTDHDFIGHAVTDSLRARAVAILNDRVAEQRRKAADLQTAFTLAREHMERGELERALALYGERLADPAQAPEVRNVVNARFGDLETRLSDLVKVGSRRLPPEPDLLTNEKRLRTDLERLEQDFGSVTAEQADGVLAVRDHPVLLQQLGAERVARLVESAAAAAELLQLAQTRKREYLVRLTERIKKTHLDPLGKAAEELVAKFQFEAALAAYRRLIAEYPDKGDPNMILFEETKQRCEEIVDVIGRLRQATDAGDYGTARVLLKLLKRRWATVPWDGLVELPLRIESVPTGANVAINGEPAGTTPLLARGRPADTMFIEVSRSGFQTRDTTIKLDQLGGDREVDAVRLMLPKTPDWEYETPGVVQFGVRSQDKNALMFLVDRSGTLTAVDANGRRAWVVKVDDLSGWLPTPVVFEQTVITTTRDGLVRSFDATSATTVWQQDGLLCEGAPVLAANKLFAGTLDGRLVAIDPAGGEPLHETALPGKVRSDLVVFGGHVFATTHNGWLVGADAATGALVFSVRMGVACAASPCATEDVVLGATIDGHLLAVERRTGKLRWEKFGIGEVELAPVLVGENVLIAHDDQLTTFRTADGARGPSYRHRERWSATPLVAENRLLVGDRKGTVSVFETEKLGLLYQLQGKAAATSISATPLGFAVCFGDKTLQFFEQLP